MRTTRFFKSVSRILIFAMLHLCWLTSFGWAEVVSTQSSLQSESKVLADRQRLLDFLNRQDVVNELKKYGLSQVEAMARINSLTSEEVMDIAGRIDELPEGGTSGCHRVIVNGKVVSETGCDKPDAGAVLAVLAILFLVVVFFIWLVRKAKVDSPSSKQGSASEPVVEEACDPGFESCI